MMTLFPCRNLFQYYYILYIIHIRYYIPKPYWWVGFKKRTQFFGFKLPAFSVYGICDS